MLKIKNSEKNETNKNKRNKSNKNKIGNVIMHARKSEGDEQPAGKENNEDRHSLPVWECVAFSSLFVTLSSSFFFVSEVHF